MSVILKVWWCCIFLVIICSWSCHPPEVVDSRPNIIYIVLDEWGYYESSHMNHPILKTPHIDQLAAEGMRFTQFLAGAPVCAPTRSVLMTGLHTGRTTVRDNSGALSLRADDLTVASLLQQAGYTTGGFGKWGLGDIGTTGVPERHGFDLFYGYYHQVHAHQYYPRYLVRNSVKEPLPGNSGVLHEGETFAHGLIHAEGMRFIREHSDRPFFAYLPWTPPHGHWHMPADDPSWIKYRDSTWTASNQRGEHDAQMYAAMIEMVDRQIGELRQLLDELHIAENTIIFLTGDNGGQKYFSNSTYPNGFFAPNVNPKDGTTFRGGKRQLYEGGLRVPFIVHWPEKIPAGQVSDHLGYFPDILPTLAELAGVEAPQLCDGHSLLPTLCPSSSGSQEEHDYLYWEFRNQVAVRMDHWKAIRPNKEASFELYNLLDDVEEKNDVAALHPDVLAVMKQYAQEAHESPRHGSVLDSLAGFKGHLMD